MSCHVMSGVLVFVVVVAVAAFETKNAALNNIY
jgi:hypothetical protein